MEFSSRTFPFLLLSKVRYHVSYQCKTKDTRLILKWITSSVSCKDLERAQLDLYRIQIESNSSHCGGTLNVAVECLAHRFALQISARRPTILTEIFHGLPQSLQVNTCTANRQFLSPSFQLVIH